MAGITERTALSIPFLVHSTALWGDATKCRGYTTRLRSQCCEGQHRAYHESQVQPVPFENPILLWPRLHFMSLLMVGIAHEPSCWDQSVSGESQHECKRKGKFLGEKLENVNPKRLSNYSSASLCTALKLETQMYGGPIQFDYFLSVSRGRPHPTRVPQSPTDLNDAPHCQESAIGIPTFDFTLLASSIAMSKNLPCLHGQVRSR